jgi:hypothetical protein
MSEWKIKKDEKRKLTAQISLEFYKNFELIKEFISSQSDGAKVTDSQALEMVIKIASKNSSFKKYIKSKSVTQDSISS